MNKYFDFKIKFNNSKFILCPLDEPEPFPDDIGENIYKKIFSKSIIDNSTDFTEDFLKYKNNYKKIMPLNKNKFYCNLNSVLEEFNYEEYKRTRCHLCFCNYKLGDNIKILGCNHYFHESCINEYFKKNNKCPFC